jgi:hypothetical protein
MDEEVGQHARAVEIGKAWAALESRLEAIRREFDLGPVEELQLLAMSLNDRVHRMKDQKQKGKADGQEQRPALD